MRRACYTPGGWFGNKELVAPSLRSGGPQRLPALGFAKTSQICRACLTQAGARRLIHGSCPGAPSGGELRWFYLPPDLGRDFRFQ